MAYSKAIIPSTQVSSSMQQLASQGQNSGAIYAQATVPMNNEATIQALIEQNRILQQQLMQRAHVSQLMYVNPVYQPMNFQHYNSFSQPQSSHAQIFVPPVSTPGYHSPVRQHVGQNRMFQGNQRQPNRQSAEPSSSNNHHTINIRFENSESKYSGKDEEH